MRINGVPAGADDLEADAAKPLALPPATVGPYSLRLAAAQGDASAQFEVASRLAEGKGADQDLKEAAQWYQRVGASGFAMAQFRLGTLYERGARREDGQRARPGLVRAAPPSRATSRRCTTSPCSSPAAAAPKPDYATAARWFTRSGRATASPTASTIWPMLYENGLGVPKDAKKAYKWLLLAANSGDNGGQEPPRRAEGEAQRRRCSPPPRSRPRPGAARRIDPVANDCARCRSGLEAAAQPATAEPRRHRMRLRRAPASAARGARAFLPRRAGNGSLTAALALTRRMLSEHSWERRPRSKVLARLPLLPLARLRDGLASIRNAAQAVLGSTRRPIVFRRRWRARRRLALVHGRAQGFVPSETDEHLPAHRRDVRQRCGLLGHGLRGRLPVGTVRRRRRLPADAAADLHGHPVGGRRRHGLDADRRLLGLGRHRPVPAQQRRREDGRRAGRRRRRRLRHRRGARADPAPDRPVRSLRVAELRDVPRRRRRADADRERRHHPQAPARGSRRRRARPASTAGCTGCRSRCASTARSSTSAPCRRR